LVTRRVDIRFLFVDAADCYVTVCLLGKRVSCGKTDELIKMQFWRRQTRTANRNLVLVGNRGPYFYEKGREAYRCNILLDEGHAQSDRSSSAHS